MELQVLLLGLVLWPALCMAGLVVAISVVLLVRGRRTVVVPLLSGLAAILAWYLPLAPALRELDDSLHRDAREELVYRLMLGELETLRGPFGKSNADLTGGAQLLSLPSQYPAAVSGGLSHRAIEVQKDEQSMRVTFFPHGGFGNGRWYVVYTSDDRLPEQSTRPGPGQAPYRIERLRDHWYRLVHD